MLCIRLWYACVLWLMLPMEHLILAQVNATRTLSGVVLTSKNQAVNGVSVTVLSSSGPQTAMCGSDGRFQFVVPPGTLTLRVEGKFVVTHEVKIGAGNPTEDLTIEVDFVVPPIHTRLVIEATALGPGIDRRNDGFIKALCSVETTSSFIPSMPESMRDSTKEAANRSRSGVTVLTWIMEASAAG